MKILLVAEKGFVEDALVTRFKVRGRECLSIDFEGLGVVADLNSYLNRQGIAAVINTATAERLGVEKSCSERHRGCLVRLLRAVNELRAPYIHLSSNLVFNSDGGGRNRESDTLVPSRDEGAAYVDIEALVRDRVESHLLLRSGDLFGSSGANILTELLRRFEVAADIEFCLQGYNSPVYEGDFARVISALIDQLCCGVNHWDVSVWGDYHYVSSDPTTHYHYAETVLAVMSQYTAIDRINLKAAEGIDAQWQRPLLNCEKILSTFGVKQLPWRSSIVTAVRNYFEDGLNE